MLPAPTSQRSFAGTPVVRQPKGHFSSRAPNASFPTRPRQRQHLSPNGIRERANGTPVVAAAVQRSESPTRYRTGPISVPTTAPAVSQHPDAIKRRRAAEERKQKRTQFSQSMASGRGWWEFQNPQNMHLIASPEEFRQRIQLAKRSNALVVADYFAPWCNACKALHPKIQQLARNNPEVTFVSVNAGNEALNRLCEEVGVTQLPYFHFLKGQQGLVGGFSANLTADKLQQIRSQIMLYKGSQLVN